MMSFQRVIIKSKLLCRVFQERRLSPLQRTQPRKEMNHFDKANKINSNMFLQFFVSWFKRLLAFFGFNKSTKPYRQDAEEGKAKLLKSKKESLLSHGNGK